jgi:hypothetical protein
MTYKSENVYSKEILLFSKCVEILDNALLVMFIYYRHKYITAKLFILHIFIIY